MPSICEFFGIIICIYYNDHAPPHFHAEYAEHEVLIRMDTLEHYLEPFRDAHTPLYLNGLHSIE